MIELLLICWEIYENDGNVMPKFVLERSEYIEWKKKKDQSFWN